MLYTYTGIAGNCGKQGWRFRFSRKNAMKSSSCHKEPNLDQEPGRVKRMHGRCARVLALPPTAASEPPGSGATLPAWQVQRAHAQAPAVVQDGPLCTSEGNAHRLLLSSPCPLHAAA